MQCNFVLNVLDWMLNFYSVLQALQHVNIQTFPVQRCCKSIHAVLSNFLVQQSYCVQHTMQHSTSPSLDIEMLLGDSHDTSENLHGTDDVLAHPDNAASYPNIKKKLARLRQHDVRGQFHSKYYATRYCHSVQLHLTQ